MTRKTEVSRPQGIQSAKFNIQLDLPVAALGAYCHRRLLIHYSNDSQVAEEFVRTHMDNVQHLGFDLEHRPTFRPGQKPNVALLQFAPLPTSLLLTTHPVLLYSIYHDDGQIPLCLQEIIRDPGISKYGVGINGDVRHLKYMQLSDATRHSFVELGPLALSAGVSSRKEIGLKALIELTMGQEVTTYKTKTLTMTNWELLRLSEAQLKYAAMDAFAAVEIYSILTDILTSTPAVSHAATPEPDYS